MLADDHVLMREGIRQLLEFDGTISVIAEANNGVECMEQLLSIHPDILLLDINMPVMNGIEVLQEIKKKNISVKVLVLTVHNEVEYLLKAVDIGVDGYIMKDAESAELKKAEAEARRLNKVVTEGKPKLMALRQELNQAGLKSTNLAQHQEKLK